MRIEGYVIVSADGMLADANGVMPDGLRFDGDKKFFEQSLDRVDLIVHSRKSFEDQSRSAQRKRIIVTRSTPALAEDPENPNATLWNPAGASFDEACERAGVASGVLAIIGGPDIFAMFLDRYDVFWLSQAHDKTLPGGVGVFPGVPARTPQDLLLAHGLEAAEVRVLDANERVDVTAWRRTPQTRSS